MWGFFAAGNHNTNLAVHLRDRRAGRLCWVLPLPWDPALITAHLAQSLAPPNTTKYSLTRLL